MKTLWNKCVGTGIFISILKLSKPMLQCLSWHDEGHPTHQWLCQSGAGRKQRIHSKYVILAEFNKGTPYESGGRV